MDIFEFPIPGPNATCPLLMLDENKGEPRNFRSPRWFVVPPNAKNDVDWTGFDTLPISANAQCGDKGWRAVVKRIRESHNGRIINLSLRQESYAFVKIALDGYELPEDVEHDDQGFLPVSWFTHDGNWAQGGLTVFFFVFFFFDRATFSPVVGLTDAEAQQWETLLVGTLERQKRVQVIFPNDSKLPPQNFSLIGARGPREMAKSHGMKFRRLFITDHCGPRAETIDKYLDLMREFRVSSLLFSCTRSYRPPSQACLLCRQLSWRGRSMHKRDCHDGYCAQRAKRCII